MAVLDNFRVDELSDGHRISCTFRSPPADDFEVFFEVRPFMPNFSVSNGDAFVAPCLLRAMKDGLDLDVKVPISERLAANLYDIAFIFGVQVGLSTDIKIQCESITYYEPRNVPGAISGFSAGIDSFFCLKENYIDSGLRSRKVTHLLFNDVGANSTPHKIAKSIENARSVAEEIGLPLITTKSNLSSFLEMGFESTHTVRNASVAHLLSSIVSVFYYSSADDYRAAGVFPTYNMSFADVILLPLLSTPQMDLISCGSRHTRLSKTKALLSLPMIKKKLDVCVYHHHTGRRNNCSKCWKCMRTEVALDALGVLEEFDAVFDLDAYRANVNSYLASIWLSRRQSEKEIVGLARTHGIVKIGPVFLIRATLVPTFQASALRLKNNVPRQWKLLLKALFSRKRRHEVGL